MKDEKNKYSTVCFGLHWSWFAAKLYIPSTLNTDNKLWHTQLIVFAVKWIIQDLSHDFHFTFQAYTLPRTLNGMFVSLFKFHTWILKQF